MMPHVAECPQGSMYCANRDVIHRVDCDVCLAVCYVLRGCVCLGCRVLHARACTVEETQGAVAHNQRIFLVVRAQKTPGTGKKGEVGREITQKLIFDE